MRVLDRMALLSGVLLCPAAATAQTVTMKQVANAAFGAIQPSLVNVPFGVAGLDAGGNVTAPVKAPSVTSAGPISANSYISGIYHLVPDTLIQAADGGDDALALNRAATQCRNQLAIRCELDLLPRIYHLNSGVNLAEAQIILHGMGIQERMPALTGGVPVTPWAGTWLQVSSTGFAPVTLGGYGGGNTVVENLGIYEIQPTPPSSGTWAPAAYGPFFSSHNGGMTVRYHDIFMLGITQGIYSDGDQRVMIDNIQGQTFQYMASIHHDYDVATVHDVHLWTFWSDSAAVVQYQQSTNDALVLGRVDGGMIDHIFSFGTRSGIRLTNDGDENSNEPGGPPTKIWVGSLSCDFTYACIIADSAAAQFDVSVGYMNTQGQRFGASPAVPISGASAFILQGYGNLNIHELYTQFTDGAVGQLLSQAQSSNVSIGALRVDPSTMQPNSFLFGGYQPSSGQDTITLATRPLIIGTAPTGFTVFQTGSGLNVVWPQVATVASGTAP